MLKSVEPKSGTNCAKPRRSEYVSSLSLIHIYSLHEVINMMFAEKLKSLRAKNGYSQEQLAEVLNVSRQAITCLLYTSVYVRLSE